MRQLITPEPKVVIGIAAAVLGAVIAIRPSTSLGVLALLIGTGLIATGALALLDRDDHRSVPRFALTALWVAAGVFVLDGSPDPVAITKRMEMVTRLFPALRSRIVEPATPLGQPRLIVDGEFDLSLHIAHYVLPPPGNWEQLLRHVRRYSLTDLDRDRALWRAVILDGLRGGRSAVVLVGSM